MLIRWLSHPARVIPAAYLGAIVVGTVLLLLPVSTSSGSSAPLIHASFTAVSALCITGLTTVDTATFWSPFGQVVIMLLIQVGGYGIVTLATGLTLVATGRVSLHGSLIAGRELRQQSLMASVRLPGRIAAVMFSMEALIALVLTVGFRPRAESWGEAAWWGVFHAISAFNNAGFALFSDNLMGFVGNAAVIVPICVAIVVGGIGFPVISEVGSRRRWRPEHWSANTRLTVLGTLSLLVVGAVVFGFAEWSNPATLGPLSASEKMVGILGGSVFPRTAGFNAVDYGTVTQATIAIYLILMFVGGGSAGTAGGVKVGTVGILLATIRAEMRGDDQVVVAYRAIPSSVQRSALTVIGLAVLTLALATSYIVFVEPYTVEQVVFETISAFGTVGLSMGITARLREDSLVVLMLLMYLGRVGTISAATALALRNRPRHYRLPEEHPIVG